LGWLFTDIWYNTKVCLITTLFYWKRRCIKSIKCKKIANEPLNLTNGHDNHLNFGAPKKSNFGQNKKEDSFSRLSIPFKQRKSCFVLEMQIKSFVRSNRPALRSAKRISPLNYQNKTSYKMAKRFHRTRNITLWKILKDVYWLSIDDVLVVMALKIETPRALYKFLIRETQKLPKEPAKFYRNSIKRVNTQIFC